MEFGLTRGYAALYTSIAIITLYFCRRALLRKKENYFLHKNGCSRLPQYRHKDPVWGIDLFLDIIRGISNGHSFAHFQSLFDKYGKTFEYNKFGQKAIFTMDSENIHTMLVTQQKKFMVEPARLPATERFMGRGIFNSDGIFWEQARTLTKPIFARAQISNLEYMEKRVDILLGMIPRDGSTVDLLPLFKRLVQCFLSTAPMVLD